MSIRVLCSRDALAGVAALIVSRAPYRLSLGGGGTDLASYYERFGGFVLSASIDKYLYVCVNRPPADALIRVKYSRYEEVSNVSDIQHDLVRHALQLQGIGSNIEIASMADVPGGTGLGSSGTYIVALLAGLLAVKRKRLSAEELAELAAHVEIDLAKHPVGKHDHYLAAFGGMTCLEIDRGGRVTVSPLEIGQTTVEDLRSRVLLFFTGITRSSDAILRAQKRDTAEGVAAVLDSLHRTKELGYRIKEALAREELDEFGRILHEHWENKKRRSAAITDPRIDRWYEMARTCGALGGKVMGAGGGGFLMLYCPTEHKKAVRQALRDEGLREMTYDFEFDGAKVVANF